MCYILFQVTHSHHNSLANVLQLSPQSSFYQKTRHYINECIIPLFALSFKHNSIQGFTQRYFCPSVSHKTFHLLFWLRHRNDRMVLNVSITWTKNKNATEFLQLTPNNHHKTKRWFTFRGKSFSPDHISQLSGKENEQV